MLQLPQSELQKQIVNIINCSRIGEELFFIDAEKAAKDILSFIVLQNNIMEPAISVPGHADDIGAYQILENCLN